MESVLFKKNSTSNDRVASLPKDPSYYSILSLKWMQVKAAAREMQLENFEQAIEILRDEWSPYLEEPPEDPYSLIPIPMDAMDSVQEGRDCLLALCYAKTDQTDLAIEQIKILNGYAITDYDKWLRIFLEIPTDYLEGFQEQADEIQRVLSENGLLS